MHTVNGFTYHLCSLVKLDFLNKIIVALLSIFSLMISITQAHIFIIVFDQVSMHSMYIWLYNFIQTILNVFHQLVAIGLFTWPIRFD